MEIVLDADDQVTFTMTAETLQEAREQAAKRLEQYGGPEIQWRVSTSATPGSATFNGQVHEWEVEVTAFRNRSRPR